MTAEEIKTMVAIHEAGHAVSACFLQISFKEVILHPADGPGDFGGLIRVPGPDIGLDSGDPAQREHLEKMIVCPLAGPAAECRHTGASPWLGGGTDLPHAVQHACFRFAHGSRADLKIEVQRLWQGACNLVWSTEGWDCVRRVAAVLEAFGRVSEDQN